jgi:sugar fermentation stimulation protein A
MKYNNYTEAVFIDRPNRFIANVEIDGKLEKVHVKNTGRCKEILIPGVNVILEKSNSPDRKTRYDLIAAYKDNFGLINIDSQAPNKVAKEWLDRQDYEYIKPEYTYGRSRIDFYMEKNGEKYLMEVKGCTLEVDGTGYFPDAPTERGVKHLRELAAAVGNGYHCIIAFVIQMEGISEVKPYTITDPEFGRALQEAKDKGVEEVFIKCKVGKDTLIAE